MNEGELFEFSVLRHERRGRKHRQTVFPGMTVFKEFNTARELVIKEGLLMGMSSGAALFAALELSKNINKGNIVVIFPDRGEKYLSTKLFT